MPTRRDRCRVTPTKTGSSAAKSRIGVHRPIRERAPIRFALRTGAVWLAALLISAVASPVAHAASTIMSAPKSAKPTAETATPAEVDALLSLLADPKVQAWLREQHATEAVAPAPAKPADESPQEMMSARVDAVRVHLTEVVDAVPTMPAEFAHAADVFQERLGNRRPARILTLLVAFAALGFGVEALFSRATRRIRQNLDGHPVETVGDRVRLVAERAAFALGSVVAFAVGSIGAFLVFHWPGLLRETVLGYLIVFLAIRIAAVLGRLLLAPANDRFRVCPMEAAAARYWYVRLKLVIGWLMLSLVTKGVLGELEISAPARDIVGYAFGLGTLAILLETIWRRPAERASSGSEPVREYRHLSRVKVNALLTAGLGLLLGLRVAGMMPAFWLLVVVLVWPLADRLTRRAVEHLLRPPGTTEVAGAPTLTAVFLERGCGQR